MSDSRFTSSSFSYSSSSSMSNRDGQVTGSREVHQSYTDPSGTRVSCATQRLGEPVVQEHRQYDGQGRPVLEGAGAGENAGRRIEDVTDEEQARRDREYEERIEEEYAKREGGA